MHSLLEVLSPQRNALNFFESYLTLPKCHKRGSYEVLKKSVLGNSIKESLLKYAGVEKQGVGSGGHFQDSALGL